MPSRSACHDNVVWIFPSGPRRTIPQHTDFDQTDPDADACMRALNWSANRDEQEDFELNIRGVSGGAGPHRAGRRRDAGYERGRLHCRSPAANRNQLKVRGVNAWDAIKAFVQFGIRSPISPVTKTDPDVIAGRALFTRRELPGVPRRPRSGRRSRVRFTPPPDRGADRNGQIIDELRQVGTFDPTLFNEVRAERGAAAGRGRLRAAVAALDLSRSPSTFFHNGVAASLDQVLENVTHRSAGTGGVDTLTNAGRPGEGRAVPAVDRRGHGPDPLLKGDGPAGQAGATTVGPRPYCSLLAALKAATL